MRSTPSVSLDIDSSNDIILPNISPNPQTPKPRRIASPKVVVGKMDPHRWRVPSVGFFVEHHGLHGFVRLVHWSTSDRLLNWWFGLVWIAGIPSWTGVLLRGTPRIPTNLPLVTNIQQGKKYHVLTLIWYCCLFRRQSCQNHFKVGSFLSHHYRRQVGIPKGC